jgi:hypothetical protein
MGLAFWGVPPEQSLKSDPQFKRQSYRDFSQAVLPWPTYSE